MKMLLIQTAVLLSCKYHLVHEAGEMGEEYCTEESYLNNLYWTSY